MSTPVLDDPLFGPDIVRREVHQGSKTEFHKDRRAGKFPAPDLYLSERRPAWLKSTLTKWQAEKLAEAKARFQVGRNSK
jgi:hypothetical protein